MESSKGEIVVVKTPCWAEDGVRLGCRTAAIQGIPCSPLFLANLAKMVPSLPDSFD
jgi:hypothetical protein